MQTVVGNVVGVVVVVGVAFERNRIVRSATSGQFGASLDPLTAITVVARHASRRGGRLTRRLLINTNSNVVGDAKTDEFLPVALP